MAMTDEEKEKLKKLSNEDLIALLDAKDEEAKQNSKRYADERKKIMEDFLHGSKDEKKEENKAEEYDIQKDPVFVKLKKLI